MPGGIRKRQLFNSEGRARDPTRKEAQKQKHTPLARQTKKKQTHKNPAKPYCVTAAPSLGDAELGGVNTSCFARARRKPSGEAGAS